MSDGSGKSPSLVQEAIIQPVASQAQEGVEDVKQAIFGTPAKTQNQQNPSSNPQVAQKLAQDQKNKRWYQFFFRRLSEDEQRLKNQRMQENQIKHSKEEAEQRKRMEVQQIEVEKGQQLKQSVAQIQAKTKAERRGGVGG